MSLIGKRLQSFNIGLYGEGATSKAELSEIDAFLKSGASV